MKSLSGVLSGAAPTVVFASAMTFFSLKVALAVTLIAALAVVLVRYKRRESLRQPVIGGVIALVCVVIAAYTGEARSFFLAPALATGAVVVVCLLSIAVGRPLAGVILHRLAPGPAPWYADRALKRIYSLSTLCCALINVVNAGLQASLYARSMTSALAALHVATGPIFALVAGLTVSVARRELKRRRRAVPVSLTSSGRAA